MKLTILCSWCGVEFGEKDCEALDEGLPRITHGICPECHTKVLNDLKQTKDRTRNDKSQLIIERRL